MVQLYTTNTDACYFAIHCIINISLIKLLVKCKSFRGMRKIVTNFHNRLFRVKSIADSPFDEDDFCYYGCYW